MGSHGSTGRDFARIRRRVPCDLLAAGRIYKGFATGLAPHEMFIQLAGSSLPRRGSDVLILLRQDNGGEALEVDAIITRQQLTEVGDSGIHRGVEVRIHGAPPEYHSLFVDPSLREDTTEVELLIEFDLADPDLPAHRGPLSPLTNADPDSDPEMCRDESRSEEDLPVAHRTIDDLPARRSSQNADSDLPQPRVIEPEREPIPIVEPDGVDQEQPLEYDAEAKTTRAAPRSHPVRAANAIVVYDGDRLKDIYGLLEQLGARPERARLSGPTRFRGWALPPRLLVVDAQDALSIEWPQNLIADGVVRIAVASTASAVIGKILRSQGFHYLIRRPVHPRAVDLLFRLALYRGPERRKLTRSTLGIDARLVTSPWRWAESCTLLELSPMGCRVVTRQDIPLLSRITLRTSRAVTGLRPISLCGRVIRRVRDDATGEWMLALRFVEVPGAQQGRLDDLLARTAVGPTSTLVDSPRERMWLWLRGLFASRSERASAEFTQSLSLGVGEESPDVQIEPDRRHGVRGSLDAEVVALDETRRGVNAVLMGRDLSLLGMRVDPHPEFVIGRRMIVAFFDSISRANLEIAAEVVRDDGDRGMGIRFIGMDADTAARLGELVAALPVVESLTPRRRALLAARIRTEDPVADPRPVPPGPLSAPAVALYEVPILEPSTGSLIDAVPDVAATPAPQPPAAESPPLTSPGADEPLRMDAADDGTPSTELPAVAKQRRTRRERRRRRRGR